jgi:hypothetical protein
MKRLARRPTTTRPAPCTNVSREHPCQTRHLPLNCVCNSGVNSQYRRGIHGKRSRTCVARRKCAAAPRAALIQLPARGAGHARGTNHRRGSCCGGGRGRWFVIARRCHLVRDATGQAQLRLLQGLRPVCAGCLTRIPLLVLELIDALDHVLARGQSFCPLGLPLLLLLAGADICPSEFCQGIQPLLRQKLWADLPQAFPVCTPVRYAVYPWIATVIQG